MGDNLKWCPNCNQYVQAQKKSMGNRGTGFVALLVLGLVALGFNSNLGIIILAMAAIFLRYGLIMELSAVAANQFCPICKATNLAKNKP